MYGWPVRVSAGVTYGVGCMWEALHSVVVLGEVLVDYMEEMWVAPSGVIGGMCCAAAWVAV